MVTTGSSPFNKVSVWKNIIPEQSPSFLGNNGYIVGWEALNSYILVKSLRDKVIWVILLNVIETSVRYDDIIIHIVADYRPYWKGCQIAVFG